MWQYKCAHEIWLVHVGDMTHSHDSLIWLTHMTHSYDSLIWLTVKTVSTLRFVVTATDTPTSTPAGKTQTTVESELQAVL